MIKGRIITHEEPVKYKYEAKSGPAWMQDWQDYGGFQSDYSTQLWAEKDQALMKMINEGTLAGLILGARVRRKNGIETLGTITHIHRSHAMAWNYTSRQIEPFKVTWDRINNFGGGSFDYKPEDLVVVPVEKHLPALLDQTKGKNNETVLHLCEPV